MACDVSPVAMFLCCGALTDAGEFCRILRGRGVPKVYSRKDLGDVKSLWGIFCSATFAKQNVSLFTICAGRLNMQRSDAKMCQNIKRHITPRWHHCQNVIICAIKDLLKLKCSWNETTVKNNTLVGLNKEKFQISCFILSFLIKKKQIRWFNIFGLLLEITSYISTHFSSHGGIYWGFTILILIGSDRSSCS